MGGVRKRKEMYKKQEIIIFGFRVSGKQIWEGDSQFFFDGIVNFIFQGEGGLCGKWVDKTSTNWCILVAKLNIPNGLNHHCLLNPK